ncbi:hypothetical protein MMC17_001859 [Xylographa soralifera]|nr:hypothetical protein [Xylographa soralifera]
MTLAVEISATSETDFPALAHIASRAMEVDLIHRIMYPSSDRLDTTLPEQFITAELRRAVLEAHAHTFKATASHSGRIVGPSNGQLAAGPSMASFPPDCNLDFIQRLGREFGDRHTKHMGGKEHAVWTSLMVLPEFQRRGIGSALLTYGLETLGANKWPVWLVTQMRGRELYRKFGFDDADMLDIDLSEYAGPHRGFGSHRSMCMIRQPKDATGAGSEVHSV